jgi:hypothetical protein
MANCPNCKTKLSCGCQKRTAKDGKTVCTSCVNTYNQSLGVSQKTVPAKTTTNVWGKNRYTK